MLIRYEHKHPIPIMGLLRCRLDIIDDFQHQHGYSMLQSQVLRTNIIYRFILMMLKRFESILRKIIISANIALIILFAVCVMHVYCIYRPISYSFVRVRYLSFCFCGLSWECFSIYSSWGIVLLINRQINGFSLFIVYGWLYSSKSKKILFALGRKVLSLFPNL